MKDFGMFFDVGLDAVDLTCRKCGGIISTDGGSRSEDCIPFHREDVEFAGFCCPKCGNTSFDMDIFAEMFCYQANRDDSGKFTEREG